MLFVPLNDGTRYLTLVGIQLVGYIQHVCRISGMHLVVHWEFDDRWTVVRVFQVCELPTRPSSGHIYETARRTYRKWTMSTFSCVLSVDVWGKAGNWKTYRCLEYYKYMRLVMSVKRLAFSTEIFCAIHATIPCPLNALHTTIAECRRVNQVIQIFCECLNVVWKMYWYDRLTLWICIGWKTTNGTCWNFISANDVTETPQKHFSHQNSQLWKKWGGRLERYVDRSR
jgi:hypothetical protein